MLGGRRASTLPEGAGGCCSGLPRLPESRRRPESAVRGGAPLAEGGAAIEARPRRPDIRAAGRLARHRSLRPTATMSLIGADTLNALSQVRLDPDDEARRQALLIDMAIGNGEPLIGSEVSYDVFAALLTLELISSRNG